MVPNRNGRERHALGGVPDLFRVKRNATITPTVHINADIVQRIVVGARDEQAAVDLGPTSQRHRVVCPLGRRRIALGRIHDDDQAVPFGVPAHRQRTIYDQQAPPCCVSANRTVARHNNNDR